MKTSIINMFLQSYGTYLHDTTDVCDLALFPAWNIIIFIAIKQKKNENNLNESENYAKEKKAAIWKTKISRICYHFWTGAISLWIIVLSLFFLFFYWEFLRFWSWKMSDANMKHKKTIRSKLEEKQRRSKDLWVIESSFSSAMFEIFLIIL